MSPKFILPWNIWHSSCFVRSRFDRSSFFSFNVFIFLWLDEVCLLGVMRLRWNYFGRPAALLFTCNIQFKKTWKFWKYTKGIDDYIFFLSFGQFVDIIPVKFFSLRRNPVTSFDEPTRCSAIHRCKQVLILACGRTSQLSTSTCCCCYEDNAFVLPPLIF